MTMGNAPWQCRYPLQWSGGQLQAKQGAFAGARELSRALQRRATCGRRPPQHLQQRPIMNQKKNELAKQKNAQPDHAT